MPASESTKKKKGMIICQPHEIFEKLLCRILQARLGQVFYLVIIFDDTG